MVKQSAREEAEVSQLERRIAAEAPARDGTDSTSVRFSDLPLSHYTVSGLERAGYTKMTEIQRAAMFHALAGRDVLGAAKTGSGKTLAFVVPLLERLFRSRRAEGDGLGALVISPTRELAMQIADVVGRVGEQHRRLRKGLVCGGTDFEREKAHIGGVSVLVSTPGRLLQHLEQSPDLDVSQLEVLVLDEADRLLDMGFRDTLEQIVRALPTTRQTLLFSATQPKTVRELAKLSLRDPVYVSAHEASEVTTPRKLVQAYVTVALGDKVNALWSFVRSHLHAKTIVFVATTKQARFLFELLRRLRPGVPLMELHGKIKQLRRMELYRDFMSRPAAVLLATDVAARGLDFSGVDWVLQLDCAEDVDTYIHRVGRTARYHSHGSGLALLLPKEAELFVPRLEDRKVPIRRTTINSARAVSVAHKVAAEVAADPQLRHLATRAFLAYVRSLLVHADRDALDLASLPLDDLALSYGLPATPQVKALRSLGLTAAKTGALRAAAAAGGGPRQEDRDGEEEEGEGEEEEDGEDDEEEEEEEVARWKAALGRSRDEAKERKNSSGLLALLKQEVLAERARGSEDEDDDRDEQVEDEQQDEDEEEEEREREREREREERGRKKASADKKAAGELFRKRETRSHPVDMGAPLLTAEEERKLPVWDRVKAKRITQAVEAGLDAAAGGAGGKSRSMADVAARLGGSILRGPPSLPDAKTLQTTVAQRAEALRSHLQRADVEDKRRDRERIRAKRFAAGTDRDQQEAPIEQRVAVLGAPDDEEGGESAGEDDVRPAGSKRARSDSASRSVDTGHKRARGSVGITADLPSDDED